MRALRCEEPGRLSIVGRDPPPRGLDEVLVRIRRVGVCGTDYHIYRGNQPYLDYPRVIGHELGGEVAEAPPGSPLRPGQIVSIEPYLYCGACQACRRGRTNCCQRLQVLGVHRDGGACDIVSVPERNVVAADGLSLDQAAMVEFLAIGAHGIRRSGTDAASRVLVAGAGPIGIAAAIFARTRGAHVTMLDINERRLAFCTDAIGVEVVVPVSNDVAERLAAATGGDFYDVVIEATGSPAAMQTGFGYVAHGGTYVFLSLVRASIAFDDPEFHKRETTLLGSRNATREDFDAVLEAMRRGQVPTDALATHRGPLEGAPDLVPVWARPETGVIKALIEV